MKKSIGQKGEENFEKAARQQKRSYSPPELLHFGMITKVTHGSLNGASDANNLGGNMEGMMMM